MSFSGCSPNKANIENSLEEPPEASLVVYIQFPAHNKSLPYMLRTKIYNLLLKEEKEKERKGEIKSNVKVIQIVEQEYI